jgi:hypothetical protein
MLSKIFQHSSAYLRLDRSDSLICSFPKTGSSGVRLFLCQYLRLLNQLPLIDNLDDLNEYMPELGKQVHFPVTGKIIKTHHAIYSHRVKKCVVIHRQSMQMYSSYVNYMRRRHNKNVSEFQFVIKLILFCLFLDRKAKVIDYSDMMENRAETLRMILRYYDIEIDDDRLQLALKFSDRNYFTDLTGATNFIEKYESVELSVFGRLICKGCDGVFLKMKERP